MVQVDLPAAFTIGHLFAYLGRDYLRKDPQLFTNRLLGPFNVFMACCYAPVGLFLLVGWPAWEIMYVSPLLDSSFDRPWVAAFHVGFLAAMVILGNVGFLLGHHWLLRGAERRIRAAIAIGALLTVLPFLLRWGIWMQVGSYQGVVEQGGGYSFWDPPFFTGWAVVMSYMAVTLVAMGWWLRYRAGRLLP